LVLAVVETHPVQYHAPVYRVVQQQFGIPVTAIYGSDFSVRGYTDREFGATFAWDTDLLSGYASEFLTRTTESTVTDAGAVPATGIRDALARLKADAVLVLGYSPRFHRVAWREARRAGARILFRGETTDAATTRSWVRSRMRRAALSRLYRSGDRFLYIGEQARAHFRQMGVPDERLVFSPYCVDASTFQYTEADRSQLRPLARRELGVSDDQVVLLFSGKLSHRKGVDLLVPAIRRLPAGLQARVTLVFVGDGDMRPELEGQSAATPPVAVRFAGFQNQRRLSRYYHAADVLVLPSRHSETWGLVVNEALLHGVPAIVSDRVGCHPDLVRPGATGAVFEAGSAEALAAALEAAVSLAHREQVRQACRNAVAAYSVERAAAGIASAYHACVPASPARGLAAAKP
jgi:glycosyltransferase involved in cell wall biosynthesis